MAQSFQLAPSLLSADLTCLRDEVALLSTVGVERLHVDIMDGHFVPNLTFGPLLMEAIRPLTTLPFEAHLMVDNVDTLIEPCAKAGANVILIHPEREPHVQRHLARIRDLGCQAGLVLNPHTPLSVLENLIPDLDQVLLMTVNPGFGGQKFIPQMLEKIRQARTLLNPYPIVLEVDGGVTAENIHEIVKAGAQVVVAGTAVFQDRQVKENVQRLRARGQG